MIKSTIYLGKGDYQRALEILQKLIPSLYELNDMENMVAAYKRIGLIYEKKGEFILALENFKKQQIFQDSLAGKNKQLSILTLEKRFETSEKEKQIFSLEAQNKLQEAEAKAQKRDKVILLITALMLLVILTFIFYRYKVNKKNENLLRDRNRALDELNNAKNKLFAVISHDLRNPVSAFRNMTEALDENFNSLPKEKTAKYLKKMRYNAVHVESQLNDLLAWASNEIGKDKLMTREVAVKELVKQVFDLLRPIAEDGGVEMDYFIDDDIRINTHPELFKTVVRNIVANAIKFTQEGGQVLLSAKYKNGAPQLLITDTGIGMEEDEIKILFSDEGKLKANEKSQMGMGLSITKDIMKRLDGEIKVTSIKGKGTSFTLKFAA